MSGRRITRQERRTVAPNLPGRKGAQAQICGHTFRRDEGEHVLAVDALFWALAFLDGVGKMFAFVDDWEIELLTLDCLWEVQVHRSAG